MKRTTIIRLGLVGLFVVASALISSLDAPSPNTSQGDLTLLNKIYINRIYIVPSIALFMYLIDNAFKVVTPYLVKHKIRRHILNTMLTSVFLTDRSQIRISVFRDVGWSKIFRLYVKSNLRHPGKWLHGKGLHCWPRWGKYIQVTERAGSINPKSRTYFFVSDSTWKDCEGIASVVRQINKSNREEKTITDLPDIGGIDLDNIDLTKNTNDAKNVKKYMEATFLKDIASLKRIFVKARHFHATILLDGDANIVGVLVIDSDGQVSPFTADVVAQISGYVAVLSSTF